MDNIQLLNLILIIVVVVLVALGGIAILLIYRMKNKENADKKAKEEMQIAANGGDPKKIPPTAMTRNGTGIKSIYDFMEFDEVKDGLKQQMLGEKRQNAFESKINQLKIMYPVDKF